MKAEDVFVYDESSPSCLTWRVDRYSGRGHGVLVASAGSPAGSLNMRGYYTTWLNRKAAKCHNVIADLLGMEVPEGCVIDHKDGDSTNNTASNLRVVTRKVNMRNLKKYANNKTGHTGVSEYSRVDCGKVYNVIVGHYKDPVTGKPVRKYFNPDKLGRGEALALAIAWRSEAINKINACGAGYLERGM